MKEFELNRGVTTGYKIAMVLFKLAHVVQCLDQKQNFQ